MFVIPLVLSVPVLALKVSSDPCTYEDNCTLNTAALEMMTLVSSAKKQ